MSIGEKKFDRTYLALPKPRNLILFHVEFCLKVLEIFLRIVGGGLGSFHFLPKLCDLVRQL
jgi:hypothetical protein